MLDRLETLDGSTPQTIVTAFMDGWRQGLIATDFSVGCSLLAVTVTAGAGRLRQQAGTHFRDWRSSLARLFASGGVAERTAAAFAAQLLAAAEGAVAVARAEGSLEAFDLVAERLRAEAADLPVAGDSHQQ